MNEAAVRELRAYSTRWGSDLRAVQGPGGNTSLKDDGRLLIKASGMRLSDAERRPIFVDLDLEQALTMARGAPAPTVQGRLRPSIETGFHAVLPHRFVMHVHATDVIAFAIRVDAVQVLEPLLAGLRWGWIPYVKPGAAIARAVQKLMAHGTPDVIVLGNHGLIVGGASCAEVDALFSTVRARLRVAPRSGRIDGERLLRLADRFSLEPARFPDAHLAAADPVNLDYATAGTLYPDHAVFLGRGVSHVTEHERFNRPDGAGAPLLHLVPGAGALLPIGASPEAHEMAACLGAVVSAVASDVRINVLTSEQEDELLDWDAETYRQQMARVR